jgi:hypothetical protein
MIGWSIMKSHHELLRATEGHYLIRTVRDSLCSDQIGGRLFESHYREIDRHLLLVPDDSSVRRMQCLFVSWPLVHGEGTQNGLSASTNSNWDVDASPLMPPSALNFQQRATAKVMTATHADVGIPDSEALLKELSQASDGLLRSSPADPRGFLWGARAAYLAGNVEATRRDAEVLLQHYHCIPSWQRDLESILIPAADGKLSVGANAKD